MSSLEKDFPSRYIDEKTILPNGITVVTRAVDPTYYHPDRTLFSVILQAGGRNAPAGHKHFLEHLVAHQGHNAAFQDFGEERHYTHLGNGAATNANRTTFAQNNRDGDLEGTRVGMEDFKDGLRRQLRVPAMPNLSAENVEFERGRILAEISGRSPNAERYWNFLNARASDVMPDGILGRSWQVAAVERRDMVDLYERLYVGSNLIVPVVFPASNGQGIGHDEIVGIVNSELGHLPRGQAVPRTVAPERRNADVRLDGKLLSSESDGYVEIAFAGVPRFAAQSPAQTAFHEIFSRMTVPEVTRSGRTYNFSTPWLDDSDFSAGMTIPFGAPQAQIRPIIDIVVKNLRTLATADLSDKVDWYQRSMAKEYKQGYRKSEDASERLMMGLALTGKPAHPDHKYREAATVTANEVTQYARSILHAPIAVRADIGPEGDRDGNYVPFAAELMRELRAGVPQPAASQLTSLLSELQVGRRGALTRTLG